jgi:polyribonucleotide 5'-hydroxyl-kinase
MVNGSRLSAFTETAAPSSALPMGSTRVLSATRLTRVDPSAPANVHRLHNAVLGLVIVSDTDKREDLPPRKAKKSLVDGAVKQENGDGPTTTTTTTEAQGDTAVKEEDGTGVVKTEGNAEAHDNDDDEDEDEDEEPIWKEEIGWREVCGFLTMYVSRLFLTCPLVSFANSSSIGSVLSSSTKIDTAKRKYELLTPSPGRLPSRVAIAGSVEWIEE